MKKIVVITVLSIFVAGNSCFAAALETGSVTDGDAKAIYGGATTAQASDGTTGVSIGKCSKGVRLGVAYNEGGYALTSKHDNGTKIFGTAWDATAIYSQEVGTGALEAFPGGTDYTAFGSGWTTM